jgi:ABC-type dipeptide/oligopeptide/nickel transport system ATPase component
VSGEVAGVETDLLRVEGLRTEFHGAEHLVAVENASMRIEPGEIHGLVGESGSGKTVFVKSLIRILPPNGRITGGRVFWRNEDLIRASEARMRAIRGKDISMIFQNPQASLNPVRTIGAHLQSLVRHHHRVSRAEALATSLELLQKVQIPDPKRVLALYPFECSGGMCQRVLIAMALSSRPKLLVADEPTTSLDVTIQAEIIRLILKLKEEYGMSVLFVSHDLGIVASICDRVSVMFRGKIVETEISEKLFRSPAHPYTRTLIESSLSFHPSRPPPEG